MKEFIDKTMKDDLNEFYSQIKPKELMLQEFETVRAREMHILIDQLKVFIQAPPTSQSLQKLEEQNTDDDDDSSLLQERIILDYQKLRSRSKSSLFNRQILEINEQSYKAQVSQSYCYHLICWVRMFSERILNLQDERETLNYNPPNKQLSIQLKFIPNSMQNLLLSTYNNELYVDNQMKMLILIIILSYLIHLDALQLVPEFQTGRITEYLTYISYSQDLKERIKSDLSKLSRTLLKYSTNGTISIYLEDLWSISTDGFSYTCSSSARAIILFSFVWIAILDDYLFVQSALVTQTISSSTVHLDFNFEKIITSNPQIALFINAVTMTQTPTADTYGYSIYVNANSQNGFQILVNIPSGYTISHFSFSVLYGQQLHLEAGNRQIHSLGQLFIMGADVWTKLFGISLTGVVVSHNIKIQIARSNALYLAITSSTWDTSSVYEITISYFRYRPCPIYCSQCSICWGSLTDCIDVYPCRICRSSTYRTGIYCNQCEFTDDQQMYLIQGELNCRTCLPYCHFCTGSASSCMMCSQVSQRLAPPDCMNCPAQMYLQIGLDNCQQCVDYCDNCFGAYDICTQCLQSTLRINPPNCVMCVSQYFMSNTQDCKPCESYCDNCLQISVYCIACNIDSMRAGPPNCLACISGYYFKADICIKCHASCKTCDEQGCLTCPQISQFIDATHSCMNCPIHCLTCDAVQCLGCITQDYILKDFRCQQCPSNCIACDPNGTCLSGLENCSRGIFIDSNIQCFKCVSHYYLDKGFCLQCANQCQECELSPQTCTSCQFPQISEHQCQLCEHQPGYYSNYSNNSCQTICGDGIVQGYEECDDFNYISHDGCTNCQVDPGYICSQFICQRIFYPVPQLYQLTSGDSPYNANKNIILFYSTPIASENILINFKIINSIQVEFQYNLTYINQSYYKIIILLLNQSIGSRLLLEFQNPINIITLDEVPQIINEVSADISDYVENTATEQAISGLTNTSVNYILIALLILILLAILFGGLNIFWNLLDILQTISYLKYINTTLPYYLFTFFELFGFLQFQNLPINSFLDTQNYVKTSINTQLFIETPRAINNDGFTSSTIINSIPIMNVILTAFATYFSVMFIFSLIKNISIKCSLDKFRDHIKLVKFLYIIKYSTFIVCDNILKQWYWSGLIRVFTSSANDICFMVCLGLYGGLQLQRSDLLLKLDSFLTLLTMFIYFGVYFIISNIASIGQKTLQLKENQYGAIYDGLKLKQRTKYYNVMLISKKFLFMASIVLLYHEPIYQILCIFLVQVTQIAYLLIVHPIKNNNERNKQVICELFILVVEIQLGILIIDDYKILAASRNIIGWISLLSLVMIILTQLCLDLYQQFLRYKKQYPFFRKLTQCFKPKQKVTRTSLECI